MKIARKISTKEYINDFQENATAESLVENAVKMGIPREDVEVLDVTKEEYMTVYDAVITPIKIAADADAELTKQQLITIGQAIKTKLGLTTNQMKLFVKFIRQIDEVDIP